MFKRGKLYNFLFIFVFFILLFFITKTEAFSKNDYVTMTANHNDIATFYTEYKICKPTEIPLNKVNRDIEIDPNNLWVNYGQQVIGQVKVLRENDEGSINLFKIESAEEGTKIIERKLKEKSGMDEITGVATLNTVDIFNPSFWIGMFVALLIIVTILNIVLYLQGRK